MKESSTGKNHDSKIVKGAIINALGLIGKASFPIYFMVVTRLYGPEIMGLFYLAYIFLYIVTSLTVAGFNDGILAYASRFIKKQKEENRAYQIIANEHKLSLGFLWIDFFFYFSAILMLSLKGFFFFFRKRLL